MPWALDQERRQLAVVIPVILRPCPWEEVPFAHLQALPRGGRAVTVCANRDRAWTEVVTGLKDALKESFGGTACQDSGLGTAARRTLRQKLSDINQELEKSGNFRAAAAGAVFRAGYFWGKSGHPERSEDHNSNSHASDITGEASHAQGTESMSSTSDYLHNPHDWSRPTRPMFDIARRSQSLCRDGLFTQST